MVGKPYYTTKFNEKHLKMYGSLGETLSCIRYYKLSQKILIKVLLSKETVIVQILKFTPIYYKRRGGGGGVM